MDVMLILKDKFNVNKNETELPPARTHISTPATLQLPIETYSCIVQIRQKGTNALEERGNSSAGHGRLVRGKN